MVSARIREDNKASKSSLTHPPEPVQVVIAKKIAEKEKKRVELHKHARQKAIELAIERKAMQLLKEKDDREHQKRYRDYLKSKEDDLMQRMDKEKEIREQKYK